MQPPENADGARAGLDFGLQAGQPRPAIGGLVVDRRTKAGQHLIAHGLGFFDRLCLGRPEQRLRRGGADGRKAEESSQAQCSEMGNGSFHVFLPREMTTL